VNLQIGKVQLQFIGSVMRRRNLQSDPVALALPLQGAFTPVTTGSDRRYHGAGTAGRQQRALARSEGPTDDEFYLHATNADLGEWRGSAPKTGFLESMSVRPS
jgi:hypothetical protein